jgi:TP901 family phage tail tape measure protein
MASRALATAFVNIVPGTKDLENYLKKELPGDADKAGGPVGERLGKSTGEGFGSKFKSVLGPVVATLAATFSAVAIGSFLKDGVTGANNLNNALAEVVTLTGTTGTEASKNFEEFRGVVKGVSEEFGLAQGVLTEGLYNALSAGVPKDNAFDFMAVASRAAIAGVTDVNTAVDGITTIVNAFGLDAADAESIADSMFTAVKGGKTTFAELSGAMFNIAPAAAAAGVNFQEVNAAIATLTAGGTPTSVATTQMRAALQGLQKPSEDLDKIFQALGYENAQLAIESQGLGFALDAVKDASGGSNGELQRLLGSSEAVAAVNVLAGTGAEKFAQELNNQATAAGAAQDALDVIDPQRALEKLTVGLDNMKLEVGNALLPVISELAETFKPIILDLAPKFAGFITNLVNGLKILADNVPTIATFAGVLGVLAIAFNGAAIATAITTAATKSLTLAMLSNPFTWVAIAIAALVAGIVYLATQTTFFQDTWKAVTAWFTEALGKLGKFFSETWANISGFVSTALNNVKESAEKTLTNVIGFFKDLGPNIIKALGAIGELLLGVGKDIIDGLIKGLIDTAANIGKVITDIAKTVSDGFKDFLGIKSPSKVFQEHGKNIGDGLVKGIKESKESVAKAAEELAKAAIPKGFEWVQTPNGPMLISTMLTQGNQEFSDKQLAGLSTSAATAQLTKQGFSQADIDTILTRAIGGTASEISNSFNRGVELINTQTNRVIQGNLPASEIAKLQAQGFTVVGKIAASQEELTKALDDLNQTIATGNVSTLLKPFAKGGLVNGPTAALIGEAGPEIVTPLADFERMLGLGENGNKTLIYHAAPQSSIDSEQALFTAMRRAKVVAAW